ncbi:MAG: Rne/Rng family ribonuclease [Alphaproteobacteria bacterium]|nr:Rne/Rng family ribonuclease [Alphaproteobacteria bacterium]
MATKRMFIDAVHPEESRVAIVDGDKLYEYDFVTSSKSQIKGNVYLAKITRVEPSLQAAFVEYGGGKQGFLPFSEIHPDYYQLPVEDKQKLLEEQIAEAEAEEAAEEAAFEREQAAREGRRYVKDDDGFVEGPSEISSEPASELLDEATESDRIDQPLQSLDAPEFATYSDPLPEDSDFTPEANINDVPAEAFSDLPEDAQGAAADGDSITGAEGERSDRGRRGGRRERGDRGENDRGRGFHRRYRIQEVIKRNQIVLVQVIKEERGNKGCSLTTYISLAGRYCVLMPNSPKGGGISRKITDREQRRNLKEMASDLRGHKGMSVIIRTAGIDREIAEIRRDYEYLIKLWNQIREQTLKSTAPALIYEEGNLIKRSLRDLFTSDIEDIVIEGEAAYNDAKEFMNMLMPQSEGKVKLHKEHLPLFTLMGVEEQLESMLEPQVRLRSGGYLIINPTEALISIDVNSGRSTSERNVEETALKTNLEAAHEIARQLRLRDLAGLIVIDFIDMNYGKNRRTIERAMKDALKKDRAKIQIARISMFGLMEMSRQRLRPSLAEAMGQPCPHCKGSGYVHSVETVGIQIVRTLEKEAASGQFVTLRVTAYQEAALHLLNEKRDMLRAIEDRYNVRVVILTDDTMLSGVYRLIKVNAEGKEVAHDDGKGNKKPRRRGRRGGKGRSDDAGPEDSTDEDVVEAEAAEGEEATPSDKPHRHSKARHERPAREPRENAEPQPPALDAEGNPIPVAEGAGKPRRERGERGGRRGRRGGRGRNNRDRNRPPREEGGEPRAPREQREARPPREPRADDTAGVPRPPHLRDFTKPSAPQPANIIPNTVVPLNAPTQEEKPKRKGWWSKMLEG